MLRIKRCARLTRQLPRSGFDSLKAKRIRRRRKSRRVSRTHHCLLHAIYFACAAFGDRAAYVTLADTRQTAGQSLALSAHSPRRQFILFGQRGSAGRLLVINVGAQGVNTAGRHSQLISLALLQRRITC